MLEPVEQGKKPQEAVMRMFPLEMGEGRRAAAPLMHRAGENSASSPPINVVANAIGQVMPAVGAASPYTNMQMQQAMPARQHIAPQMPMPQPLNAVEQFAKANKNLPDGVRFEPLDEETLKLLRDNGHLPQAEEMAAPKAETPPIPNAERLTQLKEPPAPTTLPLAQHYFEQLAQGVKDETAAAVFMALAKECNNADSEAFFRRVLETMDGAGE
jgi:hypothetical protein